MGHCSGSYSLDWLTGLEQWVEAGQAPDTLLATRLPPGNPFAPPPVPAPANLGTRTLCAYPAVSRLKRGASGLRASDWNCVAGKRGARPGHGP